MKHHQTKSTRVRLSAWLMSLLGVSLSMVPSGSIAAEDENSSDSEEAPVLSPEEFFEGGANTYDNWIEVGVGGYFPSGNTSQFQQQQQTENDVFGGIEDFHYKRDLGKEVIFKMDGRAIFDNNDYKLTLDVDKWDLGYVRFNFEQFRTWYNADGGYYAPTEAWYPFGDDALALDRGEISFEAGLKLDNVPKVKFNYTHRYRDGEKGSTSWGVVSPDPNNPNGVRRYLTPGFYDIDETQDIFELEVSHQIKATELGVGARYEIGDLNNTRSTTAYDSAGNPQQYQNTEGTTYDLLNANAYSETWIKKNLLFTSGFLFQNFDSDYSGNRTSPQANYTGLNGGSQMNQYTLNLNLMSKPWTHFSIVPSFRIQKQDWDANSGLPAGSIADSSRDSLDTRGRLDMEYTGVTNWVFYVRGEWTGGDGDLDEQTGSDPVATQVLNPAGLQRESDESWFYQKYVAGVRWYPTRRVSLNTQYYFKDHNYDYDNTVVSAVPAGSYPGYLVGQDFQTQDANVRLSYRPMARVSLVTGFDFQYHTIDTEADGLSEAQTGQTTSYIISQNISWVPWSRLFLQVGFNYVLSQTETQASGETQSILDADNNYWTLNFSSGYALTDKTDLHLGYFFYQADNYQAPILADGSEGVALGAGATEHGITCGVTHRLRENIRLNLRYGYAQYNDETYGGNLDYDSHLVYASMQYRF